MVKFLIAALLALPSLARAQAVSQVPAPVGSFTAEMVYQDDTSQTFPLHVAVPTGGYIPHDRSLFGWSAVPEINVFKWAGLQGDFGTQYMRSIYPGETLTTLAAGPRVTFAPHSHVTPFVYGEGGETRYSVQYHSDKTWMPVGKVGVGFNYRITPGFGLTMVPGEWVGTYLDTNTWNNSFEAKVGITFSLLARKSYLW